MIPFLTGCASLKMASAVQRNDIEAARKLIGQGKDLNNSRGMHFLILATCFQHVEMVKLLLDNGAPVDSQLNTQVTDWQGNIQAYAPGATPSVVLLKEAMPK